MSAVFLRMTLSLTSIDLTLTQIPPIFATILNKYFEKTAFFMDLECPWVYYYGDMSIVLYILANINIIGCTAIELLKIIRLNKRNMNSDSYQNITL